MGQLHNRDCRRLDDETCATGKPRERGPMRSLVTGAAGFIGSALVDRLLSDGHQVIGIDNLRTGLVSNLQDAIQYNDANPGRFTLIRVDVQAPELTGIIAGTNPDTIFHLAAQGDTQASIADPQFDARNNVLGTINLCEASRLAGVRRIVYATCGEHRSGAGPSASEKAEPATPNTVGKLAGELYLSAYAGLYDLSPICLALGSVYGPRQNPRGSSNVVATLASALITGLPFSVHRDNVARRDYVYVDDVVDAFVYAGCAPIETTGTFRVGTGRYTTATELRGLIVAILDGTPPPPVSALPDDEPPANRSTSATDELRFGWQPATDLREGIERTVRWLCGILEPAAGQVSLDEALAG
jgi:UDP-glucose 4-epimerase